MPQRDFSVEKCLDNGMLCPVFLKLPPENIVQFMFLLEGYDGLGVVRTLDPGKGEIVVLALKDTVADVRNVIAAVSETVQVREIPPPESLNGDWLLAEYLAELRGDHATAVRT